VTHTLSIVIPAYNESMNIGAVIPRLREVLADGDEIIVVDDGSTDNTANVAEEAGARVIRRAYNVGNGAAVKTGIRAAKGDYIIIMDGDGQHDPNDIPRIVEQLTDYHMVVGARTSESDSDLHRDVANQIFNKFATYLAKHKIDDLTSGFRGLHADIAKQFAYLLPNTFSSPTTLTLGLIRAGYLVKYIPIVAARRGGKSKIRPIADGIRFFLIMLKISTLFSPLRVFIPISGVFFGTGVLYYLYTYATAHRFTNMSMLLLVTGALTFMLGLVSEQIAQMRLDRTDEHLDE
jgi:glycosyltransferase involved in cell wall biosynthesis